MNGSDPKVSARELLEEAHPALVGLSHWIHANPEIGFEETLASGWVAEWLTTGGFEVETGAAGLPTAVIGRTGPGPFHVAICVEYDALPEVGHACGHNVIAAASIGAGLALASVAEELGLRVTVLGTPAEETGGGKLKLIDAGAFNGVHAAMMVHPWPTDVATPNIIAVNQLEVTYTGREAHAAGFPQRGRNAADALVIAQTAVGLLRQQLLPTDRVHGIVTRGGDAPNIIPAHTSAQFMVRAEDRARLEELTELVTRCFEAGALATGTEVTIVPGTAYSNMIHDPDLAALYRHNAEALGRVFGDGNASPVSTDMGDVSHMVPSIHPFIGIEANGAVNHQAAFADACATPSADKAILDGAIALAWTVIDAVQDEVMRGRLMGEALAREALVLASEAAALEQEAEVLVDAAETLAPIDAATADELALAAVELDEQAQDLAEAAAERLGEAVAIEEGSLLDEVSGEITSDAEDRAAQGIAFPSAGSATAVSVEAAALAAEAGSLDDETADLAAGAWELTSAADSSLDDVADDASVALDAAEEAAGLEAMADTLVEEAGDLTARSTELAARADALVQEAVAVGVSDSNSAEVLAATAFQFETRAQDTAEVAESTLAGALWLERDARAAEDLAEVATEAAEDAQADAIDQAVLAEVLAEDAVETADLAEVVHEASDAAAAASVAAEVAYMPPTPASSSVAGLGRDHDDWEQQFLVISAHASWDDEYARMLGGTHGTATHDASSQVVADRSEAASSDAPAEDAWYSGAADPAVPADDMTSPTDVPKPRMDDAPEAPVGDFEWIPASGRDD